MNLAGLGNSWDVGEGRGERVREGLGHRKCGGAGGEHEMYNCDHVGFEMPL